MMTAEEQVVGQVTPGLAAASKKAPTSAQRTRAGIWVVLVLVLGMGGLVTIGFNSFQHLLAPRSEVVDVNVLRGGVLGEFQDRSGPNYSSGDGPSAGIISITFDANGAPSVVGSVGGSESGPPAANAGP